MDKQTRLMLAVGSLVVAVFMGINAMTDNERSGSWLLFALLFAGLTLMFWWWMGAEERRARAEAERAAQERIRQAEEQLRRARQAATPPALAAEAAAPAVPQETPPPSASTQPTPATQTRAEEKAAASVAPPQIENEVAVHAQVPAPDSATATDTVIMPEPHAVEVPAPAEKKLPVDAAPVAPSEPEAAAASAPAQAQPAALTAEALHSPDDLTRIEGIGPYYRDILIAAGVSSFAALARLSKDDIDAIIRDANGRRTSTTATWSEQASLAAQGRWDDLAALQATLSASRRRG